MHCVGMMELHCAMRQDVCPSFPAKSGVGGRNQGLSESEPVLTRSDLATVAIAHDVECTPSGSRYVDTAARETNSDKNPHPVGSLKARMGGEALAVDMN